MQISGAVDGAPSNMHKGGLQAKLIYTAPLTTSQGCSVAQADVYGQTVIPPLATHSLQKPIHGIDISHLHCWYG